MRMPLLRRHHRHRCCHRSRRLGTFSIEEMTWRTLPVGSVIPLYPTLATTSTTILADCCRP
jgi:hypothetical protein